MTPEPQSFVPAEPAGSFLDPEPAAPATLEDAGGKSDAPKKDGAQSYDFRNPTLLTSVEQRKLRVHQEEFAQSVAARLSVHLRVEFNLKLAGIQTITYQKLAESWTVPSHFNLCKLEPLRGVSLIEISNQLGLCLVERLMGGPGTAQASTTEISEVEKVLMEQTVQLFLEEWCGQWSGIRELKPVALGYESNGSYIQTIPRETTLFVVTFEGGFGECQGQFRLSIPYPAIDPMIKRLCQSSEAITAAAPAVAPASPVSSSIPVIAPGLSTKWNACFNDVCVPVTAEWEGLELTARQILALKIGDVLRFEARQAQQINVRVADTLKFHGRPGTVAGHWAVELTKVLK